MKKTVITTNRDIRKNPDVILDLHNNWTWALPQLSSWFSEDIKLIKNENGLISPSQSLKSIKESLDQGAVVLGSTTISTSVWRDLWNYLITSPRGDLLKGGTQTKSPALRWNAGVPIILSFFKEHRNLGYESWDWTDPSMIHWMDQDLWTALSQPSRFWSREELVEFRDQGLVIKSGVKTGQTRDPKSTPNLTGIHNQEFNRLPRLLKLMLCQCWCYHPHHRHQFMILDVGYHDLIPTPLVDDEVTMLSEIEERFQW